MLGTAAGAPLPLRDGSYRGCDHGQESRVQAGSGDEHRREPGPAQRGVGPGVRGGRRPACPGRHHSFGRPRPGPRGLRPREPARRSPSSPASTRRPWRCSRAAAARSPGSASRPRRPCASSATRSTSSSATCRAARPVPGSRLGARLELLDWLVLAVTPEPAAVARDQPLPRALPDRARPRRHRRRAARRRLHRRRELDRTARLGEVETPARRRGRGADSPAVGPGRAEPGLRARAGDPRARRRGV